MALLGVRSIQYYIAKTKKWTLYRDKQARQEKTDLIFNGFY